MRIDRIIVSIFCLTCLGACGSKGNEPSSEAIVIPYANEKPESLMADRYFSDIRFVPLETNEKCLLSEVQQVEWRDSLLFVCDVDNIFLFNDSGKFVSQIGRKGRGPGEYIDFRGFFVDMNARTVGIIRPAAGLIMVYTLDGTYLHSEDISLGAYEGYYAMPVDDNKLFIFNSHNPGNNMAYTLVDRDNREHMEYFYTYDPVRIEDHTYHFAKHPMTRSGKNIHFTMPLDHHIYEYYNGEVSAKYYIETPSKIIPKEVMQRDGISRVKGTYLSRLADLTMKDNYFGGFTDIFETDSLIFIHYMAKLSYPGLYVLNKNNHTGYYHTFPSTSEKFASPVFPFSASDGNRIVSIVPMHEMIRVKDYIADNEIEKKGISADMYNTLNGMSEESNPLLIFYTVPSSESGPTL
ncbi:MAG TPA: hypothetical protein DEQ30_05630 [Porphyromonadaceae bacterium]|nr:hypothetical protein [Porphyromonadaceae bacterium]